MENLDNKIIQNINGLIYAYRSNGVKELSMTKFLLLINKKFRIELDQEALNEILSNNNSISEIIDDKIIIGSKQEQSEKDNIDDNIHDKAVDQAGADMRESAFEKYVGKEIKLSKLKNIIKNDDYLVESIIKNDYPIIIESIVEQNNILNLNCRMKYKNIKVNIPLKIIKNKG